MFQAVWKIEIALKNDMSRQEKKTGMSLNRKLWHNCRKTDDNEKETNIDWQGYQVVIAQWLEKRLATGGPRFKSWQGR